VQGVTVFTRTSRYQGVPEAVHDDGAGRAVRYKLLRIIPDAPAGDLHAVTQGDRLDRIAAAAYGDPEQSWRICDANSAFDPDDLVRETGRRLVIPQAVG
jgi:hypothetical protein